MGKLFQNVLIFLTSGLFLAGCGGGGSTNNDAPPKDGTWSVKTIAGPTQGPGSLDGAASAAGFYYLYGIVSDGTFLYVTDGGNSTIRKVEISSGAVTTLAGSPGVVGSTDSTDGTGATARFKYPNGIAIDGNVLFVTDAGNNTIRKVDIATGATTTLAGAAGESGAGDSSDGSGNTARFNGPHGITFHGSYLYVAEYRNWTIRKIDVTTGATTTLAGVAGQQGANDSSDGTGATARFAYPDGITTDGSSLYVADMLNNTIRRVDMISGATTTLAGVAGQQGANDSSDGTGATARFAYPDGIATDGTYLFVGGADHTLRKIVIATGATTTLAGLYNESGVDDSSDGTGATARFYYPVGITVLGTKLYVAEHNHLIREVAIATGQTTTLAGTPRLLGAADSLAGQGSFARFSCPAGIASDGAFAYVADYNNHNIRKVEIATGATTTLAGVPGQVGPQDSTDGTGATAGFFAPSGVALSGNYLFVSNSSSIMKVHKITGETTTLAGGGATGNEDSTDGTGVTARFNFPEGLATDGTFVYVAERSSNSIRKVNISTGATSTLAGGTGLPGANDSLDGTGATARFNRPWGITLSGNHLYVTDRDNQTIRRVHIATGNTSTLAGNSMVGEGWSNSSDGTGASARFNFPRGITSDTNYLYVADAGNHCIRRIDIATGNTITIAGTPGRSGSRDGNQEEAVLFIPDGISLVGSVLYFTDFFVGNVRQLEYR